MTDDPVRLLGDLIEAFKRMEAAAGKPIRFDIPLAEQFDPDTLAALKQWAEQEPDFDVDDDLDEDAAPASGAAQAMTPRHASNGNNYPGQGSRAMSPSARQGGRGRAAGRPG
jgi:hypothetical protein